MDVSTVPEVVIDDVIFPSTLSEADAPGSVIVKLSPTVKFIVGEVKVIVGASSRSNRYRATRFRFFTSTQTEIRL